MPPPATNSSTRYPTDSDDSTPLPPPPNAPTSTSTTDDVDTLFDYYDDKNPYHKSMSHDGPLMGAFEDHMAYFGTAAPPSTSYKPSNNHSRSDNGSDSKSQNNVGFDQLMLDDDDIDPSNNGGTPITSNGRRRLDTTTTENTDNNGADGDDDDDDDLFELLNATKPSNRHYQTITTANDLNDNSNEEEDDLRREWNKSRVAFDDDELNRKKDAAMSADDILSGAVAAPAATTMIRDDNDADNIMSELDVYYVERDASKKEEKMTETKTKREVDDDDDVETRASNASLANEWMELNSQNELGGDGSSTSDKDDDTSLIEDFNRDRGGRQPITTEGYGKDGQAETARETKTDADDARITKTAVLEDEESPGLLEEFLKADNELLERQIPPDIPQSQLSDPPPTTTTPLHPPKHRTTADKLILHRITSTLSSSPHTPQQQEPQRRLILSFLSHPSNRSCADCSALLERNDVVYCSLYKSPHFYERSRSQAKTKHLLSGGQGQGQGNSRDAHLSMMEDIVQSSSPSFDPNEIKKTNSNDSDDDQTVPTIVSDEGGGGGGGVETTKNKKEKKKRRKLFKRGDSHNTSTSTPEQPPSTSDQPHLLRVVDFQSAHTAFAPPGVNSYLPILPPPSSSTTTTPPKERELYPSHCAFICHSCALIHNTLGTSITSVKPLTGTTWTDAEVELVERSHGNDYVRMTMERYVPPPWRVLRPKEESEIRERELYARAKYETLSFLSPRGGLDVANDKSVSWSQYLMGGGGGGSTGARQHGSNRSLISTVATATSDRLVDYFAVVGTAKTVEKDSLRDSHVRLRAEILDRYPVSPHPDVSLPDQLARFVFPNGCRPSAQRKSPTVFGLALTTELGERLYGFCLMIYDEEMNMDQILGMVRGAGYEGSLSPFMSQTNKKGDVVGGGGAGGGGVPGVPPVLYLPKCLVLLSRYPMYDAMRLFLLQLYRISRNASPLPLERYLANFCSEVPLPPQGKVEIKVDYLNGKQPFLISRPPRNQLPPMGTSFRPLVTSLSTGNIITVFALLLQENRVCLLSKHNALLSSVGDALLALLFPLIWQGVYIPLLPYDTLDILEAPVPFLVGCHAKYLTEVKMSDRPCGVIFADLDNDVIHLGFEDEGMASYARSLPVLPERDAMKLRKAVEGLAGHLYVMPPSGVKGGITYGFGEDLSHASREEYARGGGEGGGVVDVPPGEGKKRGWTLTRADRAFPNNEHLEELDLFGVAETDDEQTVGSQASGKPRGRTKKRSLIDTAFDETDNFSASELREAFLRFFAALLKHYAKFLPSDTKTEENNEDGGVSNAGPAMFNTAAFLDAEHYSPDTRDTVERILTTQMFFRFLHDKMQNPPPNEIQLFDESILKKRNRNQKLKLTGNKKKTPFLDDDVDQITETYTPSPPSAWGLPDDGRVYQYSHFPKLDPSLFGNTRKPKQWKQERTLKQTPSTQTNTGHREMAQDDFLSQLLNTTPFATTPPRDLEWSLHVMAYKYTYHPNTTNASTTGNTNTLSTHDDRRELHHLIQASSTVSRTALPLAKKMIYMARRKQGRMLAGVAIIQSRVRMWRWREGFLMLRRTIVIMQRVVRDKLLGKRVGGLVSGLYVRASRIQKMIRGFIWRRRFQRIVKATGLLQKMFRLWLDRLRYLKMKHAILSLQCMHRQRHVSFIYHIILSLITLIQANIRGYLRRIVVKRLIKERVKLYRLQIFDLWRRSFTPLSYRSKFWAMTGFGFLQLALHEEELARLWRILGVTVRRSSTVFEKYQQVQQLMHSVKTKTNVLVPVLPAELDQRMGLIQSEKRLEKERQMLYEKLKYRTDKQQLQEIFKLFNLGLQEEKKKDRIVKSLWEYRGLAKQSAIFILRVYNQEDEINKTPAKRTFRKAANNIDTNTPSWNNNTNYVQAKLEHRIKNDLLASIRACMRQLKTKSNDDSEEMTSKRMRQQKAIADGVDGWTWSEKRAYLIRSYFEVVKGDDDEDIFQY